MISPAFRKAERARRRHRPVSAPQRLELVRLARLAAVELPIVRSQSQASDAITRLRKAVREPTLGRMG